MSKLFQSKKKEVSKTEIDPQIYNRVLQNLQFAEDVAAIPYEPYRGLMVAPFTRDYMAGEEMTRRIAQEGGFVPEVEAAARSAYGLMGFQPGQISAERIGASLAGGPERVSAGRVGTTFGVSPVTAGRVGTTFAARDIAAPGAAPTVQAAGFLEQDLGRYMNPYQQAVIEAGLGDISRAEEQARAGRSARATAARAFGGSRAAIEEGIAAGEAARERNRFVAEQRARAFSEAAGLRESDVAREQQARLANQAAVQNVMELAQRGQISNQERDLRLAQLGLTAETTNVESALRADLASREAALEAQRMGSAAEQFNVESGLRAGMANQQAVQDYMRMGLTAEQANQQAMLDAAARNQQAQLEGAQFQLRAGGQLADLGQSALQNRYGAAAALTGIGTAQQSLYQQYLNAQREEDLRRQQFPLQQLAIRQGAVQASPMNQTVTGTVTSRPSYWEMAGRVAAAFGSDENMKTNVKRIKNPLDKVNRLKGIEFEWEDGYSENEGEDKGGEEDMGMSAQSIEKVMPEAVSRRESDGMRQYNLPQLVGLLTEAVKELDQKVEGGKRRRKA